MTSEQHRDRWLSRQWQRLKSIRDDSPGYTDHPEADIRAHRANARWVQRFGFVAGILGLAGLYATGNAATAFAGLAFAALSFWAATGLRLEALEWEVQLERENNG